MEVVHSLHQNSRNDSWNRSSTSHVQQVVNTVEVKTLKIIEKTMHGKKLDPDDDQSNKVQSGDQTGRDSSDSVLSDRTVEVPGVIQRRVPTVQTVQKRWKRHRLNSLIEWMMSLSRRNDRRQRSKRYRCQIQYPDKKGRCERGDAEIPTIQTAGNIEGSSGAVH